ncbi:bifunctional riboflavin kinase/FAD synthetase [Spirulina sp. CS-785/01]|uniref:bifunctional riboflavin kinase/FAD synthetase n=1 Tax=Spirulina sp. CS-785/01 TaxID=3021716 RepID=UPI00232E53A0|nr:bifunctional riboflavin kinase/FAD synthetase [Spirulina sp. CS-785/01]MDB9314212.1 bifunctional riboflavin kinase/FAD synthetase [Spirulina sp. CS-785/01]
MWVTSTTETVLKPTAIALGNFDGLHRGHQQVFRPLLEATPPLDHSSWGKTYSTLVTFSPHPKEYFTGQQQQLLTPLKEKIPLLEQLGIEQLVLLPFDQELAQLSPQAFVEEILIQKLEAQQICIGQDFRFGYKRTGTAQDLQNIARQFNRDVKITPLYSQGEERISSSRIRQALEQGNISQANYLLGRPYTLVGEVVTGQKLGRTLGFPTANLNIPPEKFLPRYGVYSVRVQIKGDRKHPQMGIMNIGCRPTVQAGHPPTLEIHLLDWSGDLYGKTLTVQLEQFVRPEQKFASIDELKAQITQDCQEARKTLTSQMPS